jgi:hypothetical protein
MKMPSEAELIEIGRKFDFLLAIAGEMRDLAEASRFSGDTREAKGFDTDAEILEDARKQAHELVELVRQGARVVQDAR